MTDQNTYDGNNNSDNTTHFCAMCLRSEKDAGKLIRMPGNLCICQDCMQRSMDMMSDPEFLSRIRLPDGLDPQMLFGTKNPFGNTGNPGAFAPGTGEHAGTSSADQTQGGAGQEDPLGLFHDPPLQGLRAVALFHVNCFL